MDSEAEEIYREQFTPWLPHVMVINIFRDFPSLVGFHHDSRIRNIIERTKVETDKIIYNMIGR